MYEIDGRAYVRKVKRYTIKLSIILTRRPITAVLLPRFTITSFNSGFDTSYFFIDNWTCFPLFTLSDEVPAVILT